VATKSGSGSPQAGADQKIAAFSDHLREQIDLDTLTANLLAVVEETMQ
jgi:hypothetical protein